jgi:hypothetical protein
MSNPPSSVPYVIDKSTGCISYEVIDVRPTQSHIKTMDILVPPESTHNDIKKLAKYLYNKYANYTHVYIFIYDLKESSLGKFDDSYPEEKYFKHFLGTVTKNTATGFHEIQVLDRNTMKFVKY